jgi:transcriptional regulator with XRE-family HTH domain
MVTAVHFDADGFTAALDSTRQAKRFTWRKVADEAGVSASTLTRLSQGKRPDVDSLGALAHWAGLNIGNYYIASVPPQPVEPLAQIGAFLRADPNLGEDGANALEAILRITYEQLRKK